MMDVVPGELSLSKQLVTIHDEKHEDDVAVNEIYLDGKLKGADLIDEDDKSYGIFMHSLILSNYAEVMKVSSGQINVIGNEYEKAIFHYTSGKGFNKNLFESIAPKVDELTFECENNVKATTHLINEKMRIISKGTPDELLKRCSYILMDSKFVKITRRIYREVNDVMRDMLGRCMNVYAIAIKDMSKVHEVLNTDNYVSEMTMVALVGMGRA